MPDEHGSLAPEQSKLSTPFQSRDSIVPNLPKTSAPTAKRAEDLPRITEQMQWTERLFAEISEYVESMAPKHKRVLDEAKMRIGDVSMLLQQIAGAEVADLQHVVAPMPGIVMHCEKRVGHEVRKGDVILILDAMKMENLVSAPVTGKLISLPYGDGQKVAKGAVIATISMKNGTPK